MRLYQVRWQDLLAPESLRLLNKGSILWKSDPRSEKVVDLARCKLGIKINKLQKWTSTKVGIIDLIIWFDSITMPLQLSLF